MASDLLSAAVESYDASSIEVLEDMEHVRLRPGMYIGKLGDGTSPDDGIYVLLKEVIDNSIDEHTMGHGKHITVSIDEKIIEVRDFGRGIPLGKVVDVVSKMLLIKIFKSNSISNYLCLSVSLNFM